MSDLDDSREGEKEADLSDSRRNGLHILEHSSRIEFARLQCSGRFRAARDPQATFRSAYESSADTKRRGH
jgi:hypothetical protein